MNIIRNAVTFNETSVFNEVQILSELVQREMSIIWNDISYINQKV